VFPGQQNLKKHSRQIKSQTREKAQKIPLLLIRKDGRKEGQDIPWEGKLKKKACGILRLFIMGKVQGKKGKRRLRRKLRNRITLVFKGKGGGATDPSN